MSSTFDTFIFGYSALGLPILGYRWPDRGTHPKKAQTQSLEILILGGVHGDEPEGVICAYGLIDHFISVGHPFKINLCIVPVFNPDGVLNKSRLNGNSVDLNRNLPTKDWNPQAFNDRYPPGPSANSEPENQALVKYLDQYQPQWILSLHSWKPLLNVNGNCHEEAKAIQSLTQYSITESIGYPTPGCLGTYAGLERNMPTLTYEIERGQAAQKILTLHVPAVLSALNIAEKGAPFQSTNGKALKAKH